ncbi:MAG: Asp-tRNA(Asn)/Glu-tRNA(Gln) amidotransferase subunit GatB [Fimbriimonadaceae bacterium]
MSNFVASVGMEVHAELATRSKMFCRCPVGFGGEPNTRVCPICLGLPGTLPKPNYAAIEAVLRTALALNCTIAMKSIFHRKNYFYPDLPKGYQVSQYGETNPLGYSGFLEFPTPDGEVKRVNIRRVHLEEDTGKLMHLPSGASGIDYNRAGVPLMEIVTEFPPDITNPEEAREYLVALRQILLYLGVCDGKMEEGSLRCEPNISVRLEGADSYGTKTELKNLNSFRSVGLGVGFEVRRQVAVVEGGGAVVQETRGWNEQKEASYTMRVKEAENDYRYFPDPDLMPMAFDEVTIARLRDELPELPLAKQRRYREEFGLSAYDTGVLCADVKWARTFEACVALGADPKPVCNWMNGEWARFLNESGQQFEESLVKPTHIVDIINLVNGGTINGKTAKAIFAETFRTGRAPGDIVKESGATQISDGTAVAAFVRDVFAMHPDVITKYKNGQTNVVGFLVGQVMRASGGRAKPELVQAAVSEALKEA